MGKIIKLTESELHNLVEQAIQNVMESEELNEGWSDYFKSIKKDAQQATKDSFNNASNKFKQGYHNAIDNIKQGYHNTIDNMKQGYDNAVNKTKDKFNSIKQDVIDMNNRAMDAKAIGDIPSAIKTLDAIRKRGLLKGRNLAMVNGAITILNGLMNQGK